MTLERMLKVCVSVRVSVIMRFGADDIHGYDSKPKYVMSVIRNFSIQQIYYTTRKIGYQALVICQLAFLLTVLLFRYSNVWSWNGWTIILRVE